MKLILSLIALIASSAPPTQQRPHTIPTISAPAHHDDKGRNLAEGKIRALYEVIEQQHEALKSSSYVSVLTGSYCQDTTLPLPAGFKEPECHFFWRSQEAVEEGNAKTIHSYSGNERVAIYPFKGDYYDKVGTYMVICTKPVITSDTALFSKEWLFNQTEKADEKSIPNTPPKVAQSIPTQHASAGDSFTFVIPKATFSEADGDDIMLQVTLSDGSPLPVWLIFIHDTRELLGWPEVGHFPIKVTAFDGYGRQASNEFSLIVSNSLWYYVRTIMVGATGMGICALLYLKFPWARRDSAKDLRDQGVSNLANDMGEKMQALANRIAKLENISPQKQEAILGNNQSDNSKKGPKIFSNIKKSLKKKSCGNDYKNSDSEWSDFSEGDPWSKSTAKGAATLH